MHPTSNSSNFPYVVKMERPFSCTVVNTRPIIPNGAKLMIQRTTCDTASDTFDMNFFEVSAANCFIAAPNSAAQNRTPI